MSSSAAGSSGMSQSRTQMFDQGHYSRLHREATDDTIVGVNHQAAGSSGPEVIAAGTGPAGVPRSAAHMFDQTRYGLPRKDALQESAEEGSDSGHEPSSPVPTLAAYEALEKAKLSVKMAAENKKEGESAAKSCATSSCQSQSNDRSSLQAPVLVGPQGVAALQGTYFSEQPTQTNSQHQSDGADANSSLFVQALATSSATAQFVAPGASLPAPPTLMTAGLEASPAPQIHRRFRPSAVHTAMCDLCNKKNKAVIQRCLDCNLQFCKDCIRDKKVSGNHVANYDDLEWENVGPGLQPINTSQRTSKGAIAKKKNKSVAGGDYTPAASALCDPASARVTKSGSAARKTTRATTRASTRASTASLIRKSRDRCDDVNEDNSDYADSSTEEDPMDEDAVKEDFMKHQRRAAELLHRRRQCQEPSLVQGSSMHDAAGSDSGFGSSLHSMHSQSLREGFASSNPGSGPGMTGLDYEGVQGGYRVHESHGTTPSLRYHPRPDVYPPSHCFGMDYSYSHPSGMHPNNTQYSMNHITPHYPDAHLTASQYGSNYPRHPTFNPHDIHSATSHAAPNPYDTRFGPMRPPGHQPAADPHRMVSGYPQPSVYGTMSSNALLRHAPHERPMGERFERFGENLAEQAEQQKERDAAKKTWKEESSYQAVVRGFRYEVQAAWEGDAEIQRLLAWNKVKEAVEMFSAAVVIMGMKRTIKHDDIADVFQRVTGNEMTS